MLLTRHGVYENLWMSQQRLEQYAKEAESQKIENQKTMGQEIENQRINGQKTASEKGKEAWS